MGWMLDAAAVAERGGVGGKSSSSRAICSSPIRPLLTTLFDLSWCYMVDAWPSGCITLLLLSY
jgi:hypothetical protein